MIWRWLVWYWPMRRRPHWLLRRYLSWVMRSREWLS